MTNAAAISRLLKREFGITTLPDHRREGYRASNSGPGRVAITMQFDSDTMAARKAAYLAAALRERGYVVEVNSGSASILYVSATPKTFGQEK